jgi:microcystin degradation protein MlrC
VDGDPKLAARLVDELADRVWAERDVCLPPMRTPSAAIEEVAHSFWRHLGPVSFVDVDDIVGAGAPGGNTRIVEAILASKTALVAYVPVHDPAAVDLAWELPVGAPVSLILRGTPGYGQPEVPLQGHIGARRSERPPLPIHPKFWRELGLSPRKADLIVQKNFFHYRIFYAASSFKHLPVVTSGATSLGEVRLRADAATLRRGLVASSDWRSQDPKLRAMARRSPRSLAENGAP